MALWTDIITPAELTCYARESLAAQEARKGTLARWLPNQTVLDTVVRFVAGQAGLVEEAKFRAFDAEPEVGRGAGGKRVTVELPAISHNIPVSEYQQLRTRNASEELVRDQILKTTDRAVAAIGERVERLRGTALFTAQATIDQDNFKTADDFGRTVAEQVAPTLWTGGAGDPLAFLQDLVDLYVATNGVTPGALVTSTRVVRAMSANQSFKLDLANGGSRPATTGDVATIIEGSGLPPVIIYDRRTVNGRVTPDDRLVAVPAPVDPNDSAGTELGGTFWGQTLTSTDSVYGIVDAEQPGIVAGVYRNEKPPMIAEVISDAIVLPVLANANLAIPAKVL